MIFSVFRKFKRWIVAAAVLSLFLALHQVYIQPAIDAYYESQGIPKGVGETALGYFITIISSWTITWWLLRERRPEG